MEGGITQDSGPYGIFPKPGNQFCCGALPAHLDIGVLIPENLHLLEPFGLHGLHMQVREAGAVPTLLA